MTANKCKVKKGDNVIVLAGKDKGKKGEVLSVNPTKRKVIVNGINSVKKHEKPSATSAGGIVNKDMPMSISNVAVVDPKTGKATKIGYKTLDNGDKVRFAKDSGEIIA